MKTDPPLFRKSFFGAAVISGLLGWLLTRSPGSIDEHVHLRPLIGAAGVFSFWWLGLVGWGTYLAEKLDWPSSTFFQRVTGQLALGSLFAYFSVYFLMLGAPAGEFLKPAAFFWCGAGLLLFLKGRRSPEGIKKPDRILLLLVLIAAGLKVLEGVHLQENGDPYVCYLSALRLWFDAKSFIPFLQSPIYFLASAWDSQNQWGNFLLAGSPGTGLAEAQYFAQWISATVGYAGLATAILALLGNSTQGEKPRWTRIALLAALSVPSLRWTASLAKHDIGVCFWALAALVPLAGLTQSFSWRRSFLVGMLLGGAVIAKPTAVVFALSATLCTAIGWVVSGKKNRGDLLGFLGSLTAGSLFIAMPILIRNLSLTGNPVFPWLNSFFQSDLAGPTMAQSFSVATASPRLLTLPLFFTFLKEALFENQLNAFSLLFLLVPLLHFFSRKKSSFLKSFANSDEARLTSIAWLATVLFSLFLRKNTEVRYLGPALPLLAALGVRGLGECVGRIPISFFRTGFYALTGLWLLSVSRIPFFLLLQLDSRHFQPPDQQVLGHFGGKPKYWLRQNARPDELILALGDNEVYYVSSLRFAEMRHHPGYDRALTPAKSPAELIAILKALGTRYYYRAPVIASATSHRYLHFLDEGLKTRADCIRYEDLAGARIYDVYCL